MTESGSALTPLQEMALRLEEIQTSIADLSTRVKSWELEQGELSDRISMENAEFQLVKQIYADRIHAIRERKDAIDSDVRDKKWQLNQLKDEASRLARQYRQQVLEAEFAKQIAEREAD
jgi:hypothetical protein